MSTHEHAYNPVYRTYGIRVLYRGVLGMIVVCRDHPHHHFGVWEYVKSPHYIRTYWLSLTPTDYVNRFIQVTIASLRRFFSSASRRFSSVPPLNEYSKGPCDGLVNADVCCIQLRVVNITQESIVVVVRSCSGRFVGKGTRSVRVGIERGSTEGVEWSEYRGIMGGS